MQDNNEEDCDSIDWEDGDETLPEFHDKEEDAQPLNEKHQDNDQSHHDDPYNKSLTPDTTFSPLAMNHFDHDAAVTQTLAVMEKSGALHEGALAIQLDSSAPHNSLQSHPNNNVVHEQLKKLVQQLTARKLPRLNRWIHALGHADAMEERSVEDSTTGGGTAGPVSLVVLSEEKRALRRSLLKRMMTVRSEVEAVLRAAQALGALAEEEKLAMVGDSEVDAVPSKEEGVDPTCRKSMWLSSSVGSGMAPAPKKKPRCAKFKVIYRKK
jgi:hypothetical protein